MNPEIKKLWVDALRSGEYKQCFDILHNEDEGSFDCLGVLCDLHRKLTGLGKWGKGVGMSERQGSVYDAGQPSFYNNGFPPLAVKRWAGLQSGNPVIENRSLYSLSEHGSSFLEMADLIEKHL